MNVTLRPWTQADAEFVVKVRNIPELMRWFRQDEPLTVEGQRAFMNSFNGQIYNGQIIEADGQPVGICSINIASREFGIAVLPEWQKKGIATEAMLKLLDSAPYAHSEVFVDNPALSWYLHKLGFKATGVKERAYYKKGVGLVDVVYIQRGHA